MATKDVWRKTCAVAMSRKHVSTGPALSRLRGVARSAACHAEGEVALIPQLTQWVVDKPPLRGSVSARSMGIAARYSETDSDNRHALSRFCHGWNGREVIHRKAMSLHLHIAAVSVSVFPPGNSCVGALLGFYGSFALVAAVVTARGLKTQPRGRSEKERPRGCME